MKINYAPKLGLVGGLGNTLIDLLHQQQAIKNRKQAKLSLEKLGIAFLKGSAAGAAIGLVVDVVSPQKLAVMSTAAARTYLEGLRKENPYKSEDDILELEAEKVKRLLQNEFSNDLEIPPSDHGSHRHGVAIPGISDRDIVLLFKHEAASHLSYPVDWVANYLEENLAEDSKLIKVRKQRHSVGLIYEIEGQERSVDVVVCRRTSNKDKWEFYIYRRSMSLGEVASRVKFNPKLQADLGSYAHLKKEAIFYLKFLSKSKELPLKPVLITELCKQAIDKNAPKVPRNIDQLILLVMGFIRDRLEYVRICSPDNTNNILTDQLSQWQKKKIAKRFDAWIREIQDNPAYFTLLFEKLYTSNQ